MGKIHDLTGKRFGSLVVIEDSGLRDAGSVLWKCECDCGFVRNVLGTALSSGQIKSCSRIHMRDLVGKKFGRLLVIERAERPKYLKTKTIWWKCKCDCGTIKDINGQSLRNGHCKSCGCFAREIHSETNSIAYGEASFNGLFLNYKNRAKRDNIFFNLSKDVFREFTKKDCYYCGSYPNSCANRKDRNGEYIYNGIDRVNNLEGYTVENCVPCCELCNRMKMILDRDKFLDHVKKIYYFNFGGKNE